MATDNHRLGSFRGTQHFAGIGIHLNLADGANWLKMEAGDESLKALDGALLNLD